MPEPIHSRPFRFGLRSLFVLTALVAIASRLFPDAMLMLAYAIAFPIAMIMPVLALLTFVFTCAWALGFLDDGTLKQGSEGESAQNSTH